MDKLFHPIFYKWCDYLSKLEINLVHVSKGAQSIDQYIPGLEQISLFLSRQVALSLITLANITLWSIYSGTGQIQRQIWSKASCQFETSQEKGYYIYSRYTIYMQRNRKYSCSFVIFAQFWSMQVSPYGMDITDWWWYWHEMKCTSAAITCRLQSMW